MDTLSQARKYHCIYNSTTGNSMSFVVHIDLARWRYEGHVIVAHRRFPLTILGAHSVVCDKSLCITLGICDE